jgi:hypothetical protein
MSLISKVKRRIITKVNKTFIKYLTVERGSKRKYIWNTKNFREVTQIYLPKFLFFNFFIYMNWKIMEQITSMNKNRFEPYNTMSKREEKVKEDNKVLD